MKGDYANVKDWSLEELVSRLAGVVVDGGIEIQSRLHQNVHSILIPTYDIRATDFAKMNDKIIKKLVEDGEKAAINFITSELSSHTIEEYSSKFYHQEEIFRAVVKYRASMLEHVVIAQPNTRWFWSIFPVVLAWRMAGVRVDVLANHYPDTTSTEGRQEVQRRTLLRRIGVNFSEAGFLPIKGYILKGKSAGDSAAIVETMDAYGDKPIATFYSGYADFSIIDLAFEKLRS